MKTENLKNFEETVCAAIDSSIDNCGMTKSMSSAALFDELRMLIKSTVPKNIQEKLFKMLHNIEQLVINHEKKTTDLSNQVTHLHSAVQSLQERQYERDAILHAFEVSFLYRYHIFLPMIRRHYPKIQWSEIVNVVKQTSSSSVGSGKLFCSLYLAIWLSLNLNLADGPPSPKIAEKRRKLQSHCSVDLVELVRLSNVRNEVMHIQIANIDEQKALLEQMEDYLDSKSIREFKDSIKHMLNELKSHELSNIKNYFN